MVITGDHSRRDLLAKKTSQLFMIFPNRNGKPNAAKLMVLAKWVSRAGSGPAFWISRPEDPLQRDRSSQPVILILRNNLVMVLAGDLDKPWQISMPCVNWVDTE